ncbi:phage scaffolding protein [Thomasclavelia cocleata]|uniref:phage scaffolding protein n=1 Tax=Thomasclavelia cocleata TaxID=69824 RepID=UPI0024316F4E|nr:phage scaffolding protein [Thomasclavelia cocleata]
MKTEFLKAMGLNDEQISSIMAENGKDIEKYKKDVEKYKEQYEGTKESLDKANETIQSYKDMDIDSIKKSAEEWKSKYEADTSALNEQLAKKDYDYALNNYFSSMKFSSESARAGVIAQFKEKDFKLEDGKFVGAEEFINSLKEKDASAFVDESQNKQMPVFSKSTQSNTKQDTASSFNFNFSGVRPKPKEE